MKKQLTKELSNKMLQLYKQGLTDPEIGDIINKRRSFVFRWRTEMKLPPYKYKRKLQAISKPISDELFSAIIGILMGDGCIQYYPKHRWVNPKLKIDHCVQQREYAIQLYTLLKPINSHIKLYTRTNNFSKSKVNIYTITTDANPDLFSIYNEFYKDGIKHIPINCIDKFNATTLAYWFMDDGYIYHNKKDTSIRICTDCFLKDELEILCEKLKEKFNLHFTLISRKVKDRTYWRLRLSAKDTKSFITLVKPYMCKSLLYKLK